LEKIDQYPESKEITNDLNIVSREINTVNSIATTKTNLKAGDSDIQLNVNALMCIRMPIKEETMTKSKMKKWRNQEILEGK
jgi:hypothetical protein